MRTALLALAGVVVWVLDFVLVLVPAALGWTKDLNLGAFLVLLFLGAALVVAAICSMAIDQPRTFKATGWLLFVLEVFGLPRHRHHHHR